MTPGSSELPIGTEGDVSAFRRRARDLATASGFDAFATAAITTAASELARNAITHARGGRGTIEVVSDGLRTGLKLVVHDDGPGIADLDRALRGGYSTAKSLGLGLSGSKRLVDDFAVETAVGRGTTVTVVKWKRF